MIPPTTLPKQPEPESFECDVCNIAVPPTHLKCTNVIGIAGAQRVTAACPHCVRAFSGVRLKIGVNLWQWIDGPKPISGGVAKQIVERFDREALAAVV